MSERLKSEALDAKEILRQGERSLCKVLDAAMARVDTLSAQLRDWIAGAAIVTDQTAIPSPTPNKSVFEQRGGA